MMLHNFNKPSQARLHCPRLVAVLNSRHSLSLSADGLTAPAYGYVKFVQLYIVIIECRNYLVSYKPNKIVHQNKNVHKCVIVKLLKDCLDKMVS